jgi:hypothetical protein
MLFALQQQFPPPFPLAQGLFDIHGLIRVDESV